nr:MAG TPA: hypothetical protein [Caudoviricetes sp.]
MKNLAYATTNNQIFLTREELREIYGSINLNNI